MRLEINGIEADLGDNIINISRIVVDPENPQDINIAITNRLNLPDTQINRDIFNRPSEVGSKNKGLDVRYKAKVIDQSILFNGNGILKETESSGYPFQLQESSGNVLNLLNEDLRMLDFESEDFTFNQTNYDALKLLSSSLWIWPVVSNHTDRDPDNTRFDAGTAGLTFSRPFFRMKTILEKMFTERGWTLEYDATFLDNVAVMSNAKQFYVTSYQKTITQQFVLAGPTTVTGIDVNDFEFDVTTQNDNVNISTQSTIFRLRGDIETDGPVKISILIDRQGGGQVDSQFDFFVEETTTFIDFQTPLIESSANNTRISLILDGTATIDFTDVIYYTIIEEQLLGDLENNNLVGYRVKAYDNLPDFTQIDILRTALTLTLSIVQPDSLNKILRVKKLAGLSKLSAINWSDKFEQESEKITSAPSKFARINYLEYDNDDTVISTTGRDFFEVDDKTLKDEGTYIKIPWGASLETEINSFSIADFNIYDDVERINELNDRLVYIFNDDDVTPTFTMGRFIDLDWRNLHVLFYKDYLGSFNRYRHVQGLANIKKLDVLGFNPLDTVYIDYFKSTFIVLSIDNWQPNQLTRIKLFKFL